MITLHHLEQSRSQRLIWLLEELSIPYWLVRYSRDPATRLAPAALRALHPLGKSPMIEDGGDLLPETGAIIEYLCSRYDVERRLSPDPSRFDDAAVAWRYWLHYAEGSAMPVLAMKLVLRLADADAAGGIGGSFVDPQLRLHADFWEHSLERSGWLVGEAFSAADLAVSFPVEMALSRFGETVGERPHLTKYLDRLHARPAYLRALEAARSDHADASGG